MIYYVYNIIIKIHFSAVAASFFINSFMAEFEFLIKYISRPFLLNTMIFPKLMHSCFPRVLIALRISGVLEEREGRWGKDIV